MSTSQLHPSLSTLSQRDEQNVGFMPGLMLIVFTLILLYALRPLEISDNAIGYIMRVQSSLNGIESFYPPHLFQAPIIGLFHQVLSSVSSCDVTCASVAHSMFWAAIAVFSVFVMSRKLLRSTVGGLATAVAVLVAHGFWVYATQGEVYVPTVGCMMAATALLFTSRTETLSVARIVGVAAFWALSTTYHLASVVLFVPFAYYFFATQGSRGWRQLAIVCALAGSASLGSFISAYVWTATAPLSLASFLDWVLEITDRPLTDWGTTANLVSFGELVRAVWSQIKAITLLPDFLTLRMAPPLDQLPLAILGALLIGAVLLWNAVQVVRLGHAGWPRLFLLLMFAVFFVFFSWWQTSVHKFFIPSSVPLIIMAALAVRDLLSHVVSARAQLLTGGAVATLIALIFSFNLVSISELRASYGPFHAEAEVLDRLNPDECTIYSVGNHLNPLKLYFGQTNNRFVPLFEREFYLLSTGQLSVEKPRLYSGETCAMVPLGYLAELRFRDKVVPFFPAGRWPDYIAYMLDAQPSPEGSGITHHPFEVIETDALTYLVIDRRSRVAAADIDAVTETISAVTTRVLEANWPADMADRWGATLLALPRTNLAIGRSRSLIFGYGWGDVGRMPDSGADRGSLELN